MNCIFCADVSRAGDVLVEDDFLWIVLHEDWAVRGHTMIVWKKHVENVSDLSAGEHAHFAVVHHRVERVLLAATGADRAVLLKLGIATPHLHLHIYPVPRALDRHAVMRAIDAGVREPRDEALVSQLRALLDSNAPTE